MKRLTQLLICSAAVLALNGIAMVGTASATTLQSGGKNLPAGTEIITTLTPGTSSLFKSTAGVVVETCTQSENQTKTTNATGATVNGAMSIQITGSCSHTADVIKLGELKVEWTSGNNGNLYGLNNEFTFQSTALGISCMIKLTTSTQIGTLTGATSGNATMDINGVLSAGICGDAVWTANYTVTSPAPLTVSN